MLVVGASGYVGSAVARNAVKLGINTVCVSRRGEPGSYPLRSPLVRWVKGDAMFPGKFSEELAKADGVVHTIGTLIDTTVTKGKKPGDEGSYEQMNYETAKRVGDALQELKADKKIVYISANMHPPLLPRYLETKHKAENYLNSLPNVRSTALRPGFIVSRDQRAWSVPLSHLLRVNNILIGGVSSLVPKGKARELLSSLDTGNSVDLDDVALAAIYNVYSKEFDGQALDVKQIEACRRVFEQNGFRIDEGRAFYSPPKH